MARQLIVVLGAGASFDCASSEVAVKETRRPPLVTELFAPRFADILNEYPLAEQVAPDVRIAVSSGQVALESFLRDELRDSSLEHLRRRYYAIPLYLQHVLYEVSQYTSHPDNYDRLITEALRFDRVTFVTLNYDTLFDGRLAIDSPIASMDDYALAGRRWSLVKLHGSVNWGRRLDHPDPPTEMWPPGLTLRSHKSRTFASAFAELGEGIATLAREEIELRSNSRSLEEIRVDWTQRSEDGLGALSRYAEGQLFYPAISVPLGSPDEFLCPPDHVEHVREHQRHAPEGLNLLMIGYSGLDQAVLDLLAWGERPVANVKVVNGPNFDAGNSALQAMAGVLKFTPRPAQMVFAGGFTEFAQSQEMADYLRSIPEPR